MKLGATTDAARPAPARLAAPGRERTLGGQESTPAREWAALWTVYVVWGSTYLFIAILVETIPPLLGAGLRFLLAGALMLGGIAAWRRDLGAIRVPRHTLAPALLIGILLPGANAIITVAEQEVPSNLAALLVASIPLILVLLRAATGDRPRAKELGAVLVGFVGVALLLAPGRQTGAATALGFAAVLAAAVMWAGGSFFSPRLRLPKEALVSTGYQMLLGGAVITVSGLLAGEAAHLDPGAISTRSALAFAFLVVVGSIIAFTAYAWLLRNAPIGRTATYAYVNPLVAIVLGHLVLDEAVTVLTGVGAAFIVVSVALVVRSRGRPHRPAA